MQKRIIQWVAAGLAAVIAIGSLAGAFLSCSAVEQPEVSAASCVLMEAVTGEVLYEKNAREPRPMASTTKIMSALLCLESGDLDTEFTVDSQAIQVEGSSMGLVEGDTVTKRALCYGMLLPSGNDAAGAAAVRVAGSIPAFVAQMNERAAALGLTQTHFVTPSGLHDDDHYSTACDMAVLAASALQNENFREICAQSSAQVCFGNPPYQRWLKNSNKLLTMDESVIGVKTGFTDEAGRCLVSAAERNGVTLICVTLADPNDWQDHLSLYDWGFSQVTPAEVSLPEDWRMPVAGGTAQEVALQSEEKLTVGTADGSMPQLEYQLETAPFLYAPVSAGQSTGTWRAMLNGREVAHGKLCAAETVAYRQPVEKRTAHRAFPVRIWKRIQSFFQK